MADISKPTCPDTLPRITIVGAGICGLLLAHGLQKLGFTVKILEKESYAGQRTREWTMTIHWGLSTLQEMLPESILSKLYTAHTDPFYPYDSDTDRKETIPFYNGCTGELVVRASHVLRRVSRTRLRGVLAGGANVHSHAAAADDDDDVGAKELELDIHWGCEVTNIIHDQAEGVYTIEYRDSKSEGQVKYQKTDIVIGADGPSSFVRRWLLGDELSKPHPSRYAIGTGIVKYKDPELAKAIRTTEYPLARCASLPNGFIFTCVQNVPDPNDPSTWTFHILHVWRPADLVITCTASESEAESESESDKKSEGAELFPTLEGKAAIAKVKRVTSSPEIQEPFRSAVQEIPDDSMLPFWVSRLHYWATVPWDRDPDTDRDIDRDHDYGDGNGNDSSSRSRSRNKLVTLVGDAAHAVLPARGQGLNHGLGDIEILIREFKLVKSGEQSAADALKKYHDDVVIRGSRAALEGLEDVDGISRIVGLSDSRVSERGLVA